VTEGEVLEPTTRKRQDSGTDVIEEMAARLQAEIDSGEYTYPSICTDPMDVDKRDRSSDAIETRTQREANKRASKRQGKQKSG
jgi:hypothetical protein